MLKNEKALVVDDDPMILDMICDGMENYHIQAVPVNNPMDALKIAEEEEFDFAILDYDLQRPEMNGIQLGKELQNLYPEIIIILMTGYHNIKIAVEATRNFSFDHMIKPFRIDQLISMLERSKRESHLLAENRELMATIQKLHEEIDSLKTAINELQPLNARMINAAGGTSSGRSIAQQHVAKSYERQKSHRFNPPKSPDKES